jgi:hypothetical protein
VVTERLRIAQLDEARLTKLRALEKELGVCLVALEPEVKLADLSGEKLERVQASEKELGVVLLAYEGD